MNRKPLAVYVHVPFCMAKCAYCDFASFPNRLGDQEKYFEVLTREIRDQGENLRDYEIQTVFFGGGTPTAVEAKHIVSVLDVLEALCPIAENAEITIEGNPGTLTREKLNAYRRRGINRLSLGAQSMSDEMLRAIGRIHTAQEVVDGVHLARDCGFDNLNLDLIYALPGQDLADWENTLKLVIDLHPEHVSAYSLIVEEGTPMFDRVSKGLSVPDEDACIQMQRTATRMLAQAGFHRYEISNYAQDGRECRHNLTYWRRGEYLGFGCAAHSMFSARRFANPRDLNEYLSGVRYTSEETLTDEDVREETLMLGLRLTEGISKTGLKLQNSVIQKLKNAGLMEERDDRIRLTERGLEVQDAVVLALLE